MIVGLYRHGATAGNARGCYIGRTDEPLSDAGLQVLDCVDTSLEEVFVTPLTRTRQTARVLFPQARQIVVNDLREMDFGVFEGRSWRDMEADATYRGWVDSGCDDACPQGERRTEFSERVCRAFARLIDQGMSCGSERMVFVVHGGTIMSVLDAFVDPSCGYFAWKTGCGQRWVLETDEQLWASRRLRMVSCPEAACAALREKVGRA